MSPFLLKDLEIPLIWIAGVVVGLALYGFVAVILRVSGLGTPTARLGTRIAIVTLWVAFSSWATWDVLYPTPRPRVEAHRISSDMRSIATSISFYSAATGRLPPALSDLAPAQGRAYLAAIPSPPRGWAPYRYQS